MDRELEGADIVVASKVVQIVFVVDVVDLDLVGLALFEVVLDIEALHPGGVEVVHDNLCHAKSLPLVAHLLVEDQHTIGPCKRV